MTALKRDFEGLRFLMSIIGWKYFIERMFEKKDIGWVFLGNTSYKSQDLFWDGCFFAEIASTLATFHDDVLLILGCRAKRMLRWKTRF